MDRASDRQTGPAAQRERIFTIAIITRTIIIIIFRHRFPRNPTKLEFTLPSRRFDGAAAPSAVRHKRKHLAAARCRRKSFRKIFRNNINANNANNRRTIPSDGTQTFLIHDR